MSPTTNNSTEPAVWQDPQPVALNHSNTALDEKSANQGAAHLENVTEPAVDLIYDNAEIEPTLHARTYVALAAMWLLNFVQVFALQGPPTVLSFIGKDLNNTRSYTWITTAMTLVQTVLGPIISSASDTYQARKTLLVGSCAVSFVGSAIAPGSKDVSRLIAANVLIGIGFASIPLAYSVPSEILPRKWRPMVQAFINIAAALGAATGPLSIGALTRNNPHTGWRNFYWIQVGLWGATTLGLYLGYHPPKRHTGLEHFSVLQKLRFLDLTGFSLLTVGLSLFLTGLGLGGGMFKWTNARTLSTLIIGIFTLVVFTLYEWKGTRTGILHHDLFRGDRVKTRNFAICIFLIFVEGIMIFSYMIFYPVMTTVLFEPDAFLNVARGMPLWIATGLSTPMWAYISIKLGSVREPLFAGFLIATASIVGFTTIQPDDSTRAIIFAGLGGIGYGSPLILIVAAVQLSTPHSLIAIATAVTASSRVLAGSIFVAIYSAVFNNRLSSKLPTSVANAAGAAGLPASSIPAFVQALAAGTPDALGGIEGVTPAIINAGMKALKQAYADTLRVIFIIAVPFGVLGCIACLFIGDLRKTMTYRVDAPVEDLHAKQQRSRLEVVST